MYIHIHKDAQRYTYTQFENSSLLLKYKNMPDAETCLESVSLATAFIWHRRILSEAGKFVHAGRRAERGLGWRRRADLPPALIQPPPQTLPCLLLPPRCVSLCKQKWQWAKLLLKQLQKKNERTNGQLVLVQWLSYGRVCRYCRGEQAVGYDTPNVRKSYCT